MQKLKKNWMFILFAILLVAVVIYKLVSMASEQINWEYAENITYSENGTFSALIIRDEEVITTQNSGERRYCFANGEKIAKGSVIAEYYSSADYVRAKTQAENLETKINSLQKIEEQSRYYTADLGTVTSQIQNDIYNILDSVYHNDFSSVYTARDGLLENYNRRSLIVDDTTDFSQTLSSYNNELSELTKSLVSPIATDIANCAGYFVNFTDGSETAVDYKNVLSLTAIPEINEQESNANAVGKIVKTAKSYIAFQVDADTGERLSRKSTVDIKMPTFSDRLTVTVEAVNENENGCVVILSTMSENLLMLTARQTDVCVYFDDYTGLKVDIKAVRTVKNEDGTTENGVYVQVGKYIKYKKVDVLYFGDEFAIIKAGDSLKIKDEVVIGGNAVDERVRNWTL